MSDTDNTAPEVVEEADADEAPEVEIVKVYSPTGVEVHLPSDAAEKLLGNAGWSKTKRTRAKRVTVAKDPAPQGD